ncbi:hypothetical protein CCACVL1_29236 [Corchorus capsularis]|uniref:Uncharacterized protein n=1 Tax=Corchorus capsularis TaxID=210143 RepID=A0A1R3G2T2_COCAP|nr:hypothetical protein CCACVL1_29236 [Corchorus capsularis]
MVGTRCEENKIGTVEKLVTIVGGSGSVMNWEELGAKREAGRS